MNTLMLVALAVVALCYCGGKYCPKVLSSNKEVVLGVLVGMALCSFAGLRLEGFDVMTPDGATEFQSKCCDFVNDTIRNPDSLLTEYVYPECNDNRNENQAVKQALCSQASTNRKYKDLTGSPGKARFKQNCCGENSVPFSINHGLFNFGNILCCKYNANSNLKCPQTSQPAPDTLICVLLLSGKMKRKIRIWIKQCANCTVLNLLNIIGA